MLKRSVNFDKNPTKNDVRELKRSMSEKKLMKSSAEEENRKRKSQKMYSLSLAITDIRKSMMSMNSLVDGPKETGQRPKLMQAVSPWCR